MLIRDMQLGYKGDETLKCDICTVGKGQIDKKVQRRRIHSKIETFRGRKDYNESAGCIAQCIKQTFTRWITILQLDNKINPNGNKNPTMSQYIV